MSSSDIFDVLNIQQRSKSPGSTASPTPTAVSSGTNGNRTAKPQVTGMQRELYSLLGENQPPVVIQPSNKFKEKLTAITKPSPWTNAPFKANSTVTLHHWIKGTKESIGSEPQESQYAKLNVHLTIPKFNKEEYETFMTKTDEQKQDVANQTADTIKKEENTGSPGESWSFDEIDYLFNLCRRYDMKWFVIHDRYSFGKPRSLEDLKEKFYEVCRNYFSTNSPNDPIMENLNYPREKELERKKYLQRLLARSAAEIAEEEALIIESRKFEMAAKKTLNERESLLRLLDSPNSDQSVSQYMTSQGIAQLYGSLLSDKSKKRKHNSVVPENPWMKQQQQFAQQRQQLQQMQDKRQDGQDLGSPRKTKKQKQEIQTAMKRKAESVYAEHLLKNFSPEERDALGVITHGDKLPPGVYLRSSKISTFKPALQNKVAAILQELDLPIRPAMPTAKVINRHEELLKRITTLVDLKKHLDKLEAEKAIAK
ncbi:hypothetical protein HG536_0C03790 [Torulaspora globosa]|uniref:SWR1-complex protein 4 n=1 Tax=Torulaspora globosa TaxID=48254 RepID=A0A7G3ZFC4_9SACH|nr:uncharacterized protein HG536_0C03790 [Torulaspora globosa]QLL32210.1 hypothetical protein HG536_0C03790 [Torulaspora globosa]